MTPSRHYPDRPDPSVIRPLPEQPRVSSGDDENPQLSRRLNDHLPEQSVHQASQHDETVGGNIQPASLRHRNKGNFRNNPARAAEAGRKGGQVSPRQKQPDRPPHKHP